MTNISVVTAINEARSARRSVVTVTDLSDGSTTAYYEETIPTGVLGEAVSRAMSSGIGHLFETYSRKYFVNSYPPSARLVIIGGVHIAQFLVKLAVVSEFPVQVIDPRKAFASPERFEKADVFPDWPEDVFADQHLDSRTALIALTHDPKIDDFPIAAALRAKCFYVGALGSRTTHAKRLDRLAAQGISKEGLRNIRAPIGLDIRASGPAEIAVAILAEVIQALREPPQSRDGTA